MLSHQFRAGDLPPAPSCAVVALAPPRPTQNRTTATFLLLCGQRRVIDDEFIKLPFSQLTGNIFHFRMLALTLLEGQQLFAQVDAVLPSDVWYLNIVSNSVEPMTWRTHRCDSRHRPWLRISVIQKKQWTYAHSDSEAEQDTIE
jgi:hypothetical protein